MDEDDLNGWQMKTYIIINKKCSMTVFVLKPLGVTLQRDNMQNHALMHREGYIVIFIEQVN